MHLDSVIILGPVILIFERMLLVVGALIVVVPAAIAQLTPQLITGILLVQLAKEPPSLNRCC